MIWSVHSKGGILTIYTYLSYLLARFSPTAPVTSEWTAGRVRAESEDKAERMGE